MARDRQELDQYLALVKGPETDLALFAKSKAHDLGKNSISITRSDAEILKFAIKICGCRKFIEVGTLTGYSALHILEALPEEGELWTCERDPAHIVATKSVFAQRSSALPKVHLLEGDAVVNLKKIELEGPFDGIFIDANKAATRSYIQWAAKNIRAGGLIVCDNTFFHGRVLQYATTGAEDALAQAIHESNKNLLTSSGFVSAFIPSSDGMIFAVKKEG